MSADGDQHRLIVGVMESLVLIARDFDDASLETSDWKELLADALTVIEVGNQYRMSYLYGGSGPDDETRQKMERAERDLQMDRCDQLSPQDGGRCYKKFAEHHAEGNVKFHVSRPHSPFSERWATSIDLEVPA